jgi:hypothetical protein
MSATLPVYRLVAAHHCTHSYEVILRNLMANLQLHVYSHEKGSKSNSEGQGSGYQNNTALIRGSYDGNRSGLPRQQSRRVRIHDADNWNKFKLYFKEFDLREGEDAQAKRLNGA